MSQKPEVQTILCEAFEALGVAEGERVAVSWSLGLQCSIDGYSAETEARIEDFSRSENDPCYLSAYHNGFMDGADLSDDPE